MRASSSSRAATTARLGLVVGVLVGTVTPANATTFAGVTIEQLADASDVVVIGRVEHVEALHRGPGGQSGIHTRAVIQVAETLRGAPRTIAEVWVHGGRVGDRMRVIPGQANFRVGEQLVLLLFEAGGGLWPTGMGRGKWSIVPGTPEPRVAPSNRTGLRLSRGTDPVRELTLADLRVRIARAERR